MKHLQRKGKRKPFRVIARYNRKKDRDAEIERSAGREYAGSGLAFRGYKVPPLRDLEFEFATRLSALRAALRITETCRGVKCEVRGRIWP